MASFRRRNVVLRAGPDRQILNEPKSTKQELAQGVRPSLLDGRLTTSTGTRSLDSLLAGHAGLALGTSLLAEENGTTDFGGSLLRYFASEGVVQGHHVHVLGMNEGWERDLPGVVEVQTSNKDASSGGVVVEEKMKIAWRYERLGEFGSSAARDRTSLSPSGESVSSSGTVFCHDFDLSKRLILPSPSNMYFVPLASKPDFEFKERNTSKSPFTAFLQHLITHLSTSPKTTVHRIIIPNLLSPALYPPELSKPEHILQFLHALRALLRNYSTQLTAMLTLPLSLYPRTTGLTRWIELLSDGVLELAPFPATPLTTKPGVGGSKASTEEPPQGMLKIHRLPIFHEKGGGGGEASGFGDDLAFTLSRRKGLVIKPFSLPPVEGEEGQTGSHEHEHGKKTNVDIEF